MLNWCKNTQKMHKMSYKFAKLRNNTQNLRKKLSLQNYITKVSAWECLHDLLIEFLKGQHVGLEVKGAGLRGGPSSQPIR